MSRRNIAVKSYPAFYHPIDMDIEGKGSLSTLHYVDKRPGAVLYDDGTAEFSFYAPCAETVEVCGVSGTFPKERIALDRQEDGWFVRRIAVPEGFHYLNWFVDGVCAGNPDGMLCYGCFKNTDFLDVPADAEELWLRREVPHGTIRYERYTSGENLRSKTAVVYTPPGYESSPDRRYPVLYLQHGVGEDEVSWLWNGKVNYILDNLIAEGECPEMIVVMNAGYAFRPSTDPVFYPGDFDSELVYDCMPFIERSFRVLTGREHTAVAGLSLGSAQAARSALLHPDLFGYFGVFSGGFADVSHPDREEGPRYGLVFLGGGASENLTGAYGEMAALLRESGSEVQIREYPGFHEWSPWRHCLADFVKGLFRAESLPAYPDSRVSIDRTAAAESSVPGRDLFSPRNQAMEMNALFQDPIWFYLIRAVDENGRPAGRYRPARSGAEVLGEGLVRLNFPSKKSARIEAAFGGERYTLACDPEDENYYSVRVNGVKPGYYYIDFFVNGNHVIHPTANVGYGGFHNTNFFEMEDPAFTDYVLRDVPHGSLRLMSYSSSVCGSVKPLYIYTPHGYEESGEHYPVIYLQHGGGENETGWIWQGKICNILDNLIAEGRAAACIVVMASGYAFYPDGSSDSAIGSFSDEMAKDIVPFVDEHFRTLTDREHRAMAGLSMGGFQTQYTVFHHPELFANAGIFSALFKIRDDRDDYTDVLYDRERFLKQFRYLFVGIGEQDVRMYDEDVENMRLLKEEYGLPIEFYHVPGIHDWTFWRKAVVQFLQGVFLGQ